MGVFRAICDGENRQAERLPASAGRHFLGDAHGCTLARSAFGIGQVELGLSAIPKMEPCRSVGPAARCTGKQWGGSEDGPDGRLHGDPRPPSGSRRKRGTQSQALGRSRGGFTSKIHARTNGDGLPLAFIITPGEAHDATAYKELMDLDEVRPKALLADRGYDSDAIREDAWFHGTNPVIPTKINRKVQRPVDPLLYALRNRIERFFNKLKNARRVATRYDKTVDSFLAFVQLASIRIWLRFVNRS